MIEQQDLQIDQELKTTDKLAYERTILAQERTLMAMIRTSVSLISFGFTIAKFFQELKTMDVLKAGTTIPSSTIGYYLVLIGTVYIIASSVQHQLILKSLYVTGLKKRFSFTFMLAIVISLLGISLLISFYSNIFSLGLNK